MNKLSKEMMEEFYRSSLGKEPCWDNDKIAVAAALRKMVSWCRNDYDIEDYCEDDWCISVKDVNQIIDELENKNDTI